MSLPFKEHIVALYEEAHELLEASKKRRVLSGLFNRLPAEANMLLRTNDRTL